MIGVFGSMTVFAAGTVNLSTSTVSAHPGDTVSITVNVTSNSGFAFLMVTPSYDSSALTLVETVNGNVCGSMTSGKNPNWNGNGQNVIATGLLVTLKFKINDNATIKNYDVGVSVRQCYNVASENVSCNASGGQIKVTCKTHSYGTTYTKISDTQHGRTCSACGNVEKASHTWDGGTVTKTASCKEVGEKKFTCTACNATKTESIAKTNNHKFGPWSETKGATCTTTGTQTRTCSVCQKTETSTINAKGHSFGAWSQTSAPSCTTQGQQKRTCTRSGCSHSETKTIAALGHVFSNPTVTKQPTCTEIGVEIGTCSRCNQKTTNTIKATGHKYGNWTEVTAATCMAGGQEERTCAKCSQKETRATESLGHDFENPTLVKEATLTTTGSMEGKCKRCGETTQEIIPCTAEDTTTGISVEATEGIFVEGTTTNFTAITKDDGNYESVKNAVADKGSRFAAYNIQYMLNGAAISPNGEYTLLLPNADKVSGDNMLVLHIAEDGTVTEKEFTVNEDDKIAVKTAESGTYVVVDKSTTGESKDKLDTTDGTVEDKDNTKNTLWIVITVAAVVLTAGVVTAIVANKKKKSKKSYE